MISRRGANVVIRKRLISLIEETILYLIEMINKN